MSQLKVFLLGPPAIRLDDQPFTITRRLQRTLLYYLSAQTYLSSRSEVVSRFWGTADESSGRQKLRDAISKLRSQLPNPKIIITEQDRVGLNWELTYVDWREYIHLVKEITSEYTRVEQFPEARDQLTQKMIRAVQLWRSPVFIAGGNIGVETEEFESWLIAMRTHLQTTRQNILDLLAQQAEQQGNPQQAILWLQTSLEGDELNENINFRLISVMENAGLLSQAADYTRHLLTAHANSHQSLSPNLAALCQRVIQNASESPNLFIQNRRDRKDGLNLPLVGRGPALQALEDSLDRYPVTVVSGEPGIGKTRLVQEFLRRVFPPPRLLYSMNPPEQNLSPYQSMINLLRNRVLPQEWEKLDPLWIPPLARLMPDLSINLQGTATLAVTPEAGQRFILEAIFALFNMLAVPGRLIFVLDDAQWVDEGTLNALNFLLDQGYFTPASKKSGHAGNQLIVIYRIYEDSPALRNALDEWKRKKIAHPIHLGRLSYQDCETLVASLPGNAPARILGNKIVEPLYKVTSGNPLFILETLRASVGKLLNGMQSENATVILPDSLQTLITRRVALLSRNLRMTLASAAVIGREFTVRELEHLVDLSPDELASALEELEQENFLVPAKLNSDDFGYIQAESGYQFSHDRIRESILENISPARLRQRALAIAQMLQEDQRKPYGQAAFRIAGYYETAGEYHSAFSAWLNAAAYAQSILDPSTAYAAWTRAEEILKRHPDLIGEEDVLRLYQNWGELASQIFDIQELEKVYSHLRNIGEHRQSYLLRAIACTGLASVCELRSEIDEGIRLAQKAITLLEYCGNSAEHARAFYILGILNRRKVSYPEAVDAFQSALKHLSIEKSPVALQIQSRVEYNLAITKLLMGEFHQSWEALATCQEHSNLIIDLVLSANIYLVKIALLYYSGEYTASLALTRDGLEFTERTRQMGMHGYIHVYASKVHLILGNLDAAWEDACEAIRLGNAVKYHTVTAFGYSQQGQVLSMLGDFQGAAQKFEEGLKISLPDNLPYLENLSGLGSSMAMGGKVSEGLIQLDAALTSARLFGNGLALMETLFTRMMVDFYCGKTESALQALQEIRTEATRRGYKGIDQHARMFELRAKLSSAQSIAELEELLQALQFLPEANFLWVDIAKCVMIAQIEQQLGRDTENTLEQLKKMLQNLEQNCQSITLRPLYNQYQARIAKGLAG
ncbi:MAG TPA: AAA family ATPase [Anaerolineaceae bacterium]